MSDRVLYTPEAATGGVLAKACTFAQVFSYEFCEISNNTFFIEHLWATASDAPLESASSSIQVILPSLKLLWQISNNLENFISLKSQAFF